MALFHVVKDGVMCSASWNVITQCIKGMCYMLLMRLHSTEEWVTSNNVWGKTLARISTLLRLFNAMTQFNSGWKMWVSNIIDGL